MQADFDGRLGAVAAGHAHVEDGAARAAISRLGCEAPRAGDLLQGCHKTDDESGNDSQTGDGTSRRQLGRFRGAIPAVTAGVDDSGVP